MKTIRKEKDINEKKLPVREIVEFTNPVEISGDGEYLYITEIETDLKSNFTKELLQCKQ